MRTSTLCLALVFAAAGLVGCGAAPGPQSPAPPPSDTRPAPPPTQIVAGSADSAGAVPGSAGALYVFRFKQTEPSSSAFNFRDRDLSFFFRPSPIALYFRVENLQGLPVQIDWDHSSFVDVDGRTGKVAHSTTRWRDRYSPLVNTQVGAQQQYGDFMFPIDYLLDPGAASPDLQLHRQLVPEDSSAPSYAGRTFGVDLAFLVQERPRTYSFRFQVMSVTPR